MSWRMKYTDISEIDAWKDFIVWPKLKQLI